MCHDETVSAPKLYNELAEWWPLLSAPEDYEEEATYCFNALQEAAHRRIDTMRELGCGGGNNASFMKHRVKDLVLVDLPGDLVAPVPRRMCESNVVPFNHSELEPGTYELFACVKRG